MIWAATTLCFFGFFHSGEITVPTEKTFDSTKHLAWGYVVIDNIENPQLLMVHQKKSKSDQLGKGVDVDVGKTDCFLCPVIAITQYMAIRGSKEGPFFQRQDSQPLNKSSVNHSTNLHLPAE